MSSCAACVGKDDVSRRALLSYGSMMPYLPVLDMLRHPAGQAHLLGGDRHGASSRAPGPGHSQRDAVSHRHRLGAAHPGLLLRPPVPWQRPNVISTKHSPPLPPCRRASKSAARIWPWPNSPSIRAIVKPPPCTSPRHTICSPPYTCRPMCNVLYNMPRAAGWYAPRQPHRWRAARKAQGAS